MKKITIILMLTSFLMSCNGSSKEKNNTKQEVSSKKQHIGILKTVNSIHIKDTQHVQNSVAKSQKYLEIGFQLLKKNRFILDTKQDTLIYFNSPVKILLT